MGVIDTIEKQIYSAAVKAATPVKIKIEWNYLPDWLIDFSASSSPSGPSKFLQLTKPKVYVLTRSGYTFGFDAYSKKPVPVPPDAFKPGKFQSFLQSKDFKTFLLFSLAGLFLKKLASK